MTDTPPPPPPPPDPVYLLLIDSRVANYQDIINSKQPGVYHVVFHVPETATSSKVLFEAVQAQIAELGVTSFTSIGLVQHNEATPRYEMFGKTFGRLKPIVQGVEAKDPRLETWNHVALFITMLRINYRIQYFDMMACALYSNPDWKYVIDELTRNTGVTVRASTDDTGAAALGGDWFLESHTGVNLKEFYFTEAIENYKGVLVSEPGSGGGSGTAKRLILIDSRIKDIHTIINAVNADTYCLVFNYFYDTPATILSKLRFLTGDNRYILDQFYYEEPVLPTRMDASGNHCTPCDDFDMDSFQLLPATLQTEYMSYTMDSSENNGRGLWPFYSQSSDITIQKPVFFQRSKVEEDSSGETVSSYESTDMSVVAMNYKARPFVLVSDLDEIYQLAQTAGEIAVGDSVVFDCVGIIQHAVPANNGYKLVDNYGTMNGGSAPALVTDIQSADPNLSSWTDFIGFIQRLKTVFHITTLDMMACALYSNPDWKYIIDLLAARENIRIRASLDNTGTVLDEGNWILETNDIDLTDVYFTDKIYDWKYVLTTYIDNRLYALRWNNIMYATRSYDARLKFAAGTNNFTIETWYYETVKQSNATIVDMGNYNYTFQIRQSGRNGLAFYNSGSGWLYADSAVVPEAQWSHLAMTRSGSTITFYINGVARQTFTSAASFSSDNGTFAIGWQDPNLCRCNLLKLDSALYDLRLWSVARTATEIQMNRNRIIPANTTGLIANYLLTDNSGNLNDRTANGLHTSIQSYTASRWSNSTVPIPNVGFLINNGYSLRTDPSGGSLNALTTFDDITYTDFSGVDLSGVNFANANLTGSNLTNANLTNANFSNTVIVGATLTGAITTGSSISLAITSPTHVLQLDGGTNAVNLGVPTWAYSTQFRTTMTVECWFKTTDTNNQKTYTSLVTRNSSGSVSATSQFSLYMLPTGEIGFGLTNNANVGSYHTTTAQYKDTQWHHVACTYNSATRVKNIYIDGVLSRTDTAPSGFGLLSNNSATRLMFGSDDGQIIISATDRQFRGFLSDIRIWDTNRSATDISNNMRQRLIGNESGLVGYWKLHQGYETGWGTMVSVYDSTTNRLHGSIIGTVAWVISTGGISFQPRISAITLGLRAGTYSLLDNSFSFIDPATNGLGDFTYTLSPGTVATVANGASTRKTIYATSGAVTIPTNTTFDFPEISSLPNWQIDISFTATATGGAQSKLLVGDFATEYIPNTTNRGWGIWVSTDNKIVLTGISLADARQLGFSSFVLNTPYVLSVLQSSGTITATLQRVSTQVTETESFAYANSLIGKGPVTIGGIRFTSDYTFVGTISYVNVSVPTVERVVTLLSVTGGTPATVTATQIGYAGLESGTKTANFSVIAEAIPGEAPPTIGTLTVPAKTFGDASFNLTAPTSNSSGAFTYTMTSTTPQVATVTPEGRVTILGAGTTTITATQAESGYYTAGSVTASFVVSPAAPTIGALTGYKKILGDASFNITAPTSNSGGAFTYTSSVAGVATVTSGGTVTIVGAGNTIITATQAAAANYASGSVDSTVVVSYDKPFVLQFDGNDDYVNVGTPSWCNETQFRQTMTVEYWFKTTNTNPQAKAYPSIVTRSYDGGISNASQFAARMIGTFNSSKNGSVSFGVTSSSSNTDLVVDSSPTKYNDGVWHHFAGTYTSSTGTISIYVDGGFIKSATNANFGPTSISHATTIPIFIGSDAGQTILSGTDRNFQGFVSDVRIWNTVRSAADISNNYQRRLIGNETGLVGYWKMHQCYNTGWETYTRVLDSTSNRAHGTLTLAGTTPTASWVLSTGSLSFQPNISAITLGSNAGTYSLLDNSFSFIDPSSSSLGDFTYTLSPGTVATVADGASTRKTVYATSGAVTIPTLTTFDFPEIASLPDWQIDISFTQTSNAGSLRALIGDMYNEINTRGWGVWVSSSNRISWSWSVSTAEPTTISVSLNTPYVLTVSQSSRTITMTLRTISSGVTQTGSFSVGSNIMGKGPVTIGGWRTYATENFPGTISYVNVSVPTNERVVTLSSVTSGSPATVTATQLGYVGLALGTKTASLAVVAIEPTISQWTLAGVNFGVAPFALSVPSSNSTGAFSYESLTPSVATVSGNMVTVVSVGSATFRASQDASGAYSAGSVTATLVVSPINPIISPWIIADMVFIVYPVDAGENLELPNVVFGVGPITIADPSSNSLGAFSYESMSPSVATISGNIMTIVRTGTVTVKAIQQAYGNYNEGEMTATFTVSPIAPTISTWTIADVSFGVAPFTLTDPSSNSTGAFAYTSLNTAVATVSGNTVTVLSVGTASIRAVQEASGNYTSRTVDASFAVSPIAPTISTWTIADVSFGVAPFTLTDPSSNSTGAFAYTSLNTAVATVSGNTVTVLSVGTATIRATQDACGNYSTGAVTASLVVSAALSNFTVSPKIYGDLAFDLTDPTSTDTSVGFTFTSGNTTVATIGGGGGRTVSIVGVGSSIITATQAATINRNQLDISATLVVSPATPVITIENITKVYGDTSFRIQPSSTNTDTVGGNVFSFSSDNIAVVSFLDASLVRINGVGTARISITQAASANFTDSSGSLIITVNKGASGFTASTFSVPTNKTYGDPSFNIITSPSSFSNGTITYDSSNSSVATINNSGVITLVGYGTVYFIASQAATALYNAETKNSNTLTVARKTVALERNTPTDSVITKSYGDSNFTVVASNESNGTLSYSSGNSSLAQVNSSTGVVSIVGIGTTTITATRAETAQYTSSSISWTLEISRGLLAANNLSSSSFVVASKKINTDSSFNIITAPTSNSSAPIVYASTNTSVATIHPSTGVITLTGTTGFSRFTASQAITETHESGSITSNELFVDRVIDFTLTGLNQTLNLTELAALDAASIALGTSDATAVMYVRVSDMLQLFQYQTDSFDINNVNSSDVKYYVFHHKLPNELKLNPSHAMLNKAESIGMLGIEQGYNDNRSLVKHDFIRYVATRLFNTIHGVDLFQNENDLRENVTYMGEIVRNNIQDLLSEISTTSANESMPYDASGNKYLTNDASGNTNLGRELMRQIASAEPSRFYNNGDNNAMLKNVPLKENDTILFKLTIASATGQNMLTGVTEIPPRTYNIKLVLKNTVSSITNANTVVDDSDMYSTSYAYSPNVTTYAPTSVSSNVYNPYSPPAPIPFSRFGFNGWYYTNSTTWVNISSEVNNRVKWAVPANTPGSSTVSHLQYARVNLKIFNKSALPYLVIYTQSGSSRKYAIASPNSLTTGGKYSFYINFNSYSREPANIGYTNAEMTYSGSGSGSFADNEVITSLALETSDNLATSAVEFTLATIIVGELVAPSIQITEKEYGFSANVPTRYP